MDCLALLDDGKAVVVLGDRNNKQVIMKYDIATGQELGSSRVQGATGLSEVMLDKEPCVAIPYGYVFYNYRPQTKLREGNVFTPVCDSVNRGRGVSVQGGLCPMASLCPVGGICPGSLCLGDPMYGKERVVCSSTHPTGMHSC